ncbi:MAG: AraC family transcriptional regulator [Clostridia bacterium]|nr:AraC family transcriptional regulator [Clostridia bacterium]
MKIVYYRHNTKTAAMAIPKQKINFCELTIVYKGRLDYTVNGTPVSVSEGQALFIKNDSERERAESETKADYVSFNFVDSERTLPLTTDAPTEIKMLTTYCDARVEAVGNAFFDEAEKILECVLYRLTIPVNAQENAAVNLSKAYIKEHLHEKITLSSLAEETHYSQSRLSVLFKKATGRSPNEFIVSERVEKAKELLIEGVKSEEDIGYSVGFSDVNYFIRAFRKRAGVTPYQYRKLFITTK